MDNNVSANSNAVVEVLLNQIKQLQKTNAILQVLCAEKEQQIEGLQKQLATKETKKATNDTKKNSHK